MTSQLASFIARSTANCEYVHRLRLYSNKVHALCVKEYLNADTAYDDFIPVSVVPSLITDKHLTEPCSLLDSDRLSQVAGEIDVHTLGNCKPVGHELERDNVKETLQTIDSLRNLDLFGLASCKFLVVWIADNNGPTATSNDCKILALTLRLDMK
jgi:hypothetical protein